MIHTMLIKDIQDKELRELAIKRAIEQNPNKTREEVLEMKLFKSFKFRLTDEGSRFWYDIYYKRTISLPKPTPEPTTTNKDRELLAMMSATIYCSCVTENNIKLSVQSAIELLKEIDNLNKQ